MKKFTFVYAYEGDHFTSNLQVRGESLKVAKLIAQTWCLNSGVRFIRIKEIIKDRYTHVYIN